MTQVTYRGDEKKGAVYHHLRRFTQLVEKGTNYYKFFKDAVYGEFSAGFGYDNNDDDFFYRGSNGRVFVKADPDNISSILSFLRRCGIRERDDETTLDEDIPYITLPDEPEDTLWKNIGKAEKKIIIEEYCSRFTDDEQIRNALTLQIIFAMRTDTITTKCIKLDGHSISHIENMRFSKRSMRFKFSKYKEPVEPDFILALPSRNDYEKKRSHKIAVNTIKSFDHIHKL